MPCMMAGAVLQWNVDAWRVFAPGLVRWAGDRIVEVGPWREPLSADEEPSYRLPECAVLPGFLNGHNHAAMSLFRGLADDSPLFEWLEQHIWPREAKLTAEDIYIGTLLAAAEMIHSGTVGFADMYFEVDAVARAVQTAGLRGWIARGLIGNDDADGRKLEAALEAAARWRDVPLVIPMLGPHAPYTCSPAYLERVAAAAARHHLGIHIHLAESPQEVQDSRSRYGKTPIQLAKDAGLLEQPTLIAHGVHIEPEDQGALSGMRGGVVSCPVSNAKLGNGIFPFAMVHGWGVPVGLGTDGAASTNTLDMFEEMKAMAWFQKLRNGRPEAFGAQQSLYLATQGTARVLEHPGGNLAPGQVADFIALSLEASALTPNLDLVSNLVYAAVGRDVRYTVVAGKVLMAEGRILAFDEAAVRAEAKERAAHLLGAP